jgi:hypothetical protein
MRTYVRLSRLTRFATTLLQIINPILRPGELGIFQRLGDRRSHFRQPFGLTDDHLDFFDRRLGRRPVVLPTLGKQLQPAASYFVIRPSRDHIEPTAQYDMQVVRQHGLGQAIDPEDRRQELHPLTNPRSTMLERFPRDHIFATQKRSPDAALDGMHDLDFIRIEVFPTRHSRHDDSPVRTVSFEDGFYGKSG